MAIFFPSLTTNAHTRAHTRALKGRYENVAIEKESLDAFWLPRVKFVYRNDRQLSSP